ncbi:MAG: hypothetical protein JXC85_03355 [Candidatus Aenigmarchaeota archaeon]|nr:hypothetical protein [Candidatus Aenigmarchaeota archaeon]
MNIGLIFGVIVAMLLMGMIIVFGYQQITNMQLLQEQAQIKKSIEGLAAAVERVHSLSGETSEPFTLTFPASVGKVCFLPAYRGERVSVKKSRLITDLRNVIEGTSQERFQLSSLLLEMRIAPNPDGFGEIDKNQTLLVFFQGTPVPMFETIPHLEPTKKDGPGGPEILCVEPRTKVWLQRGFDENGAWVDVEAS